MNVDWLKGRLWKVGMIKYRLTDVDAARFAEEPLMIYGCKNDYAE